MLAAVLAATFLQQCCGGVTDADAFFHFRQARDYLLHGLSRPSTPFSFCMLGQLRADIWYGFHMFLLPFAKAPHPFVGLAAATVAEITVALLLLHLALRRLRIPYPWLWPFFMLVFSPTAAHVLLKVRPQVLSAGLGPLLLAVLIAGPTWAVFLVAAALTWVHPSFVWVIPVLAGVVFAVKGRCEGRWEWKGAGVALLGGVAGLLARPHPILAAKAQYVQLVTLQMARAHHLPIDFGAELDPMGWARLAERFLVTPVLWVAAIGLLAVCYWRRAELAPRARTVVWSALICAAGFSVMTVAMTYRAVPLWTAFTALSIGSAFGLLVFSPEARRGGWLAAETRGLLTAALGIFVLVLGYQAVDDYALKKAWLSPPIGSYPRAGRWLYKHSRPGDLVANISWDTFPELYFWSPTSRFVYGMDPIFLYAQNPRVFWKIRHLNDGALLFHHGRAGVSTGAAHRYLHLPAAGVGARYVFLEFRRPGLSDLDAYLSSDRRFVCQYADDNVHVFEVRR